ncbi:TetR/AcrR family transcriptional regulator [Domibacillus robiginosus]|uniref:TetR/AcrR family transcriptional regulator n=1 Tax=Domibacillus robiginosus TaxID=1071054 RepID=UPI00155B27CE|nr:TetR/AcrR family transcriptional regulator [Domibacillus robiginosus]
MKPNESKSRPAGRPRSEEARKAIIRTVIEMVEQKGFSALSIERVAEEANVSKATIYRWWKSKESLLMSAFLEMTESKFDYIPSLKLEKNLENQLEELSKILKSPLGKALISVVIENQEISDQFSSLFLYPRRNTTKSILKQGVENGQICKTSNIDAALDMLFGAIYLKAAIYKQEINRPYIISLVEGLLKGVEAKGK